MPARLSAQTFAGLSPVQRAIAVMRTLRSAEGCPWDREQTMQTLQRYTLEEVYEVFEAIDEERWSDLRDELGDLLLQVLFYAQIAADEGRFDIEDVAAALSDKLVRRHPHVFGDVTAEDAAAVVTLATPWMIAHVFTCTLAGAPAGCPPAGSRHGAGWIPR